MVDRQTLTLVDTHCHVDLHQSPAEIVQQAEREHIYTIAVTNAPSVFPHTSSITAGSKYVSPAIGLHPELVQTHKHELDYFQLYLAQTRFVGEVGLDFTTTDNAVRQAQCRVLSSIAEWANDYGDRILTVHSRKAATDVISLLEGIKAKIILHWFSGTNKELARAISGGLFFSVNSAMLRSEKGRSLVVRMPKERVLTETDSPFVKVRGRPATPHGVKATVNELAELWAEPAEQVQLALMRNFESLLKL